MKNIFKKRGTVFLIFITLLTALTSITFSRYYSSFHKKIILKVREPVYSVKFNANGGTGNMSSQNFIYGESKNLYANNFTKEGYVFKEWNTQADGSGISYQDKELIVDLTNIDGNIINLYAIYEKSAQANTFSEDSWETINNAVSSGNYPYQVGDTKCVALDGFTTTNNNGCSNGEFLVRIANTSTPAECSGTDFSQSACGFVLEFVDIITTHKMNPAGTYKNVQYNYGWNVDGWPETSMREFVNSDIYNALPQDLQKIIIDTEVVSGHGPTSGESNFSSTDKLYLLSAHEVWEDGTSSPVSGYDTAYNNTRQLDYYKKERVTTNNNNYSKAIKKKGTASSYWWLRGAISSYSTRFLTVNSYGGWSNDYARSANGVAPAFRIG